MESIIEVLKYIEEKGIHFYTDLLEGCSDLSPEQIVEYIKDPELFIAKDAGITVDHLRKFLQHQKDPGPCRAITSQGKPCKGIVRSALRIEEFRPGFSEYCSFHQKFCVLGPSK